MEHPSWVGNLVSVFIHLVKDILLLQVTSSFDTRIVVACVKLLLIVIFFFRTVRWNLSFFDRLSGMLVRKHLSLGTKKVLVRSLM